MSEHRVFLLTLLCGMDLAEIALTVSGPELTADMESYPMEPENREKFLKLLPAWHQELGPIVRIRAIRDSWVVK